MPSPWDEAERGEPIRPTRPGHREGIPPLEAALSLLEAEREVLGLRGAETGVLAVEVFLASLVR
jgi:hypothetical protein